MNTLNIENKIQVNLESYWSTLSSYFGEKYIDNDIYSLISISKINDPFMNPVFDRFKKIINNKCLLEEVSYEYKKSASSFTIYSNTSWGIQTSKEAGIQQHLDSGDIFGMLLPTSHSTISRHEKTINNKHFEIREVKELPELIDWATSIQKTFKLSHQNTKNLITLHAKVLQEKSPYVHYVGYFYNQPACSTTIYTLDDTVAFYNTNTIPQARNMGLMTQFMLFHLNNPIYLHKKYFLTFSDQLAMNFFKRLGFKKINEYKLSLMLL